MGNQETNSLFAFLDLKAAFDSISRELLWVKLAKMNMDPRLLSLIKNLYTRTSCQGRYNLQGNLTLEIPIRKGVKQGCILATTLFNLF